MRISDLRDSDDEQFLADIILSIALSSPFAASKSKFDNYYSKGDIDKSDEIDVAIVRYGENNLGEDIKRVLSWIQTAITTVAGTEQKNFLSKTLNPKAKGNTVKEPFYSLFMAFYDLIIKNSKEPFDYHEIFHALDDLASKIKMSSTITERNRVNNIGMTKGLIENYFKSSTTTTRSSGSYALDFVNYLRRSRVESPNYDFKQGLYTLSNSNRQFDAGSFEKILQNLVAMANLGKGKKGYIFIGVSDNEQHTQRIEELDGITAPRVNPFGIVGLDREAHLRGTTLDDYILLISRKIRESDLPEVLKTRVNTSLTPITYEGHTVLMLEASAGTEPMWYNNKLYIRDGHEKKPQEVSGDQIAAVYSLFK